VAVGVTFVWLGLVLGISFLETPLKFRAPGVTLPIGLGIGRLVFRALNAVEAVCAVAVAIAVGVASPDVAAASATVAAVLLLAAQLAAVRPALNRRSAAVLAAQDRPEGTPDVPRSNAHFAYVGLEGLKVLALLALGISLLTALAS
jgi:hypothetical protein